MPSVVIRNLSAETHRALKARAVQHGRSTEAEIRDILDFAALSPGRVQIGSELLALGRKVGEVEIPFERDARPTEPASFD
jgi:plasmid stability protein